MWGSAFAASVDEIFLKTAGSGLSFLDGHRGKVNITGKGGHADLPAPLLLAPAPWLRHKGQGRGDAGLDCPTGFREVLRK